jgi:RNA polymerase sigma-70 factor (ECF subfamily)
MACPCQERSFETFFKKSLSVFCAAPEGVIEEGRVDGQEEFLGLFLKHQDDLRAFLGSVVRDWHARDDLFQEITLILWRQFDRYDRARPFGAWARGVAAKKVMQDWEQSRRRPTLLPPEAVQAMLDAYDRTEPSAGPALEALEQCLERLRAEPHRLFVLRYREGLRLADIAAQFRSTSEAIHKALSRLRTRLQRCVEQRLAAWR